MTNNLPDLTALEAADMTAGAALRRARLSAGLTQQQLAQRWGTRQATISHWERSADLPGYLIDATQHLSTLAHMRQSHES